MRILFLLVPFLILQIAHSQLPQPAFIFPSTISPVALYSTTPVVIITKIATNNWATRVNTSFSVNPQSFNIYLNVCFGYGNQYGVAPRIFTDTFKVGALPPGTYTVNFSPKVAYSLVSCSLASISNTVFTFEVSSSTPVDVGINESNIHPLNFSFLPNPVFDELEVNFNQQEQHPIHLQLFNLFGQLVYEERFIINETKKKIDVRFLKSGVYYLKLPNGTSELVKKLIKN